MSNVRHPDPLPSEPEGQEVDQLVASLIYSELLTTLDVSDEDIRLARSDPNLLETLRIACELLDAFRVSGVLDIFKRLPSADQANFIRWIGMTDDPNLRGDRIRIFVAALERSPLAVDTRSEKLAR